MARATFRALLIALATSLLLSFSALAASLLSLDRCLGSPDKASHEEVASMHQDCEGGGPELDWLDSAAQLLCDSGLDCQLSAAMLPVSSVIVQSPPMPSAFSSFPPSAVLATSQAFWRPPRA